MNIINRALELLDNYCSEPKTENYHITELYQIAENTDNTDHRRKEACLELMDYFCDEDLEDKHVMDIMQELLQ